MRREIADTSMADSNLLQVLQRDYDWQHFTIMWRQEYKFETKRLADIGNPHKVTVDQMHMNALNRLISALPLSSDDRTVGGCSIDALSKSLDQSWTQDVRDRLNFAWHLLEPWPDSVAGMQALQSRFKIGTLTNGNLNLMVDMAQKRKATLGFSAHSRCPGQFQTGSANVSQGHAAVRHPTACRWASCLHGCRAPLRSRGRQSVWHDHRLCLVKGDRGSTSRARQAAVCRPCRG